MGREGREVEEETRRVVGGGGERERMSGARGPLGGGQGR